MQLMKAPGKLALSVLVFMASLGTVEAQQKDHECTSDKDNVPTCKREGIIAAGTDEAARKRCVFTCTQDPDGVWTCVGNGPQCNGQSPWS